MLPDSAKVERQRMVEPENADATSIVPHALYAERSNARNPSRKFPVGLGSKISISHLLFQFVICIDQKTSRCCEAKLPKLLPRKNSRVWYSIPRDKLLFPLRVCRLGGLGRSGQTASIKTASFLPKERDSK